MRHTMAVLLVFSLLCAPMNLSAGDKKPKNSDLQNIGKRDITDGSWNFYSVDREMAFGNELAHQVLSSTHLFKDPVVTRYVRRLADRVARNSDLHEPLRVYVIDSDEINAFALPGGHFFINTGLILESRSEAELAGVIAHEIAHVAARHATRQMTKAQIWNLVSIPLLFVGGPVAYGIQQGLSLAVPLTFLKFSRNYEREADFLGQEYQYECGYDPAAFVDFFERMKSKEKEHNSAIVKAFSSHPMTKDRIKRAERTIETILPPREEYVVTTSEFDQMHAYLENLMDARRLQQDKDGPVLRKRTSESFPASGEKQHTPF